MVAHENEGLGEAERSKAGRQRDLRRFIDDADVELAPGEDRTGAGVSERWEKAKDARTHSLIERQVVATI